MLSISQIRGCSNNSNLIYGKIAKEIPVKITENYDKFFKICESNLRLFLTGYHKLPHITKNFHKFSEIFEKFGIEILVTSDKGYHK